MSLEEEVRKASKQFYAGLNSMANGDSGPVQIYGRITRS